MDKAVKDLYMLMLKHKARVKHFLEYKNYYEIHLEWDSKIDPYWISPGLFAYGDDVDIIQTKLITFGKDRR